MGAVSSVLRSLRARLTTAAAGPPESLQRMQAAQPSSPPLPPSSMSFWVASTRDADQQLTWHTGPLEDVDVLVLGGGIVGITTAYLLRQQGLKVGLLESGTLCEGVTGHSTAKLTSQHGVAYTTLTKKAR